MQAEIDEIDDFDVHNNNLQSPTAVQHPSEPPRRDYFDDGDEYDMMMQQQQPDGYSADEEHEINGVYGGSVEAAVVADEVEPRRKEKENINPFSFFTRSRAKNQNSAAAATVKPQKPPPMKKSKYLVCKVLYPDDETQDFDMDKRAIGSALLDDVMSELNIIEGDYFGLRFTDGYNLRQWLVPDKKITDQLKRAPPIFTFEVKFYPLDPSQLQEDITRYYLALQIRQNIAKGGLPCAFVTSALLGSYAVQSEVGDYDEEEHGGYNQGGELWNYITHLQFAPNQGDELLQKIAELHRTHIGMSPADADRHYLENATKLALYGVELHDAIDSEGIEIRIGLSARGILVHRNKLRINRFAWPKVLKLSYRRKLFYVRLRAGEFEQFEATVGFDLKDHRLAKRLWKAAVEYHSFYRYKDNEVATHDEPGLFRFGSKFRYSGRTLHQAKSNAQMIDRPQPEFERTLSRRLSKSVRTTDHLRPSSAGSRASSLRNINRSALPPANGQITTSAHRINEY